MPQVVTGYALKQGGSVPREGGRKVAGVWWLIIMLLGGIAGGTITHVILYHGLVPVWTLLTFVGGWVVGVTISWVILRRRFPSS